MKCSPLAGDSMKAVPSMTGGDCCHESSPLHERDCSMEGSPPWRGLLHEAVCSMTGESPSMTASGGLMSV